MKFFIYQNKKGNINDSVDESFLNSTKAPSLISDKVFKKELGNFTVYIYTYSNIYDEKPYVSIRDDEILFVNGLFTLDESEGIDDIFDFFDNANERLIIGNYQALKLDENGNGFLKTSMPTIYPLFHYENENCVILSNEYKLIVDGVKEFRKGNFIDFYDYDYIDELFEYGELYKGDEKTTYSHTIFKNIKRILVNDEVTFKNGSVSISYDNPINVPKWFEDWYFEDKDSLYDWYWEKLLFYSEEFVKIISKNTKKVTAGITGGFDSRLTCMVLGKILPKYGIDFITNTTGLDDHPDVIIGKEVVSALGLNWESENYLTKEDDNLRYFPQSFQEYAKCFYTQQGEMSSYNAPETFTRDVSDVREFFQHGNDIYKHENVNSIKILARWSSKRRLYVLDFYFPLFGTELELWFSRLFDKYHHDEKYYKEFVYNVLKRGDEKLLEIPFAFDELPQVDVKKYEFKGYYSTRHREQPFLWDYQYVLDKLDPLFYDRFEEYDRQNGNVLTKSGLNSLDYFLMKKDIDDLICKNPEDIEKRLAKLKEDSFYPKSRQFVDLRNLKKTFYITTTISRLMDFASAADFNSFDSLEKACSFNMEDKHLEIEDGLYKRINELKLENEMLVIQNKKCQGEIDRLNNINSELLTSQSWKLTKPLRSFKKTFKK